MAMISEQFRLAAKDWVDKDSAANMLEETKSAVLSQRMAALGDMPVSKAEMAVKASQEWRDFIEGMVNARTAANLARMKLEYIRMRFSEWQSKEATSRAEKRL
jgi:putative sterol carrier protein